MKEHNEILLQQYLLNLIAISTDILQHIDNYELNEVESVGHLVSALAEFRTKNYIEIPF